jgi:fatty acid desaturase
METPGDRELRRRRRAAERSQIRAIRRRGIALFGMSFVIVLLTYGLDWLALAVLVVTMTLLGWMFVKDK